jgi:hypothetical protein
MVLSLLLHAAAALLIPPMTAPIALEVRAVPGLSTSPANLAASRASIFPEPTLLLAEAVMSPAKAKIEAAKQAALEKSAARVVSTPAAIKTPAASQAPAKPKTFAELLEASVAQKESIAGKLSDVEYAKLEARVRAAYPGLE